MRTIYFLPAVLAALMGCASDFEANDTEVATATQALLDGSPEGIGVLSLLNDASTTLTVLDDDAKLNARSARNLIHYRNGYDGDFGTFDDNLFGSVKEVDSVRWVGPSALRRLIDYAHDAGWVPTGDQILGTWDGVTFTADEALATLELVNASTYEELDDDLRLHRRAAASVVEAQPVATIAELAGCYYVGRSALQNLLEASAVVELPVEERFVTDLAAEVISVYADLGADIESMGGNTLEEALGAIALQDVEEVTDASDDPYAHDLQTTLVLAHPDVLFDGGDAFWFGAYDRASGELLEVYSYE